MKLHPRAVSLFFFRSFIHWLFLGYIASAIILGGINIATQKEVIVSPGIKYTVGVFSDPTFNKINLILILSFCSFILGSLGGLLWGFLVYKNYSFELGKDFLKIQFGIVKKTTKIIPYQNIQEIQIIRKISERLIDLATIYISTAAKDIEELERRSRKLNLIDATYGRDSFWRKSVGSIPGLLIEDASKIKDEILLLVEKSKKS